MPCTAVLFQRKKQLEGGYCTGVTLDGPYPPAHVVILEVNEEGASPENTECHITVCLWNKFCLCILIVMHVLFCIFCFHCANWHSSATMTEVFPCFFPSCKADAGV